MFTAEKDYIYMIYMEYMQCDVFSIPVGRIMNKTLKFSVEPKLLYVLLVSQLTTSQGIKVFFTIRKSIKTKLNLGNAMTDMTVHGKKVDWKEGKFKNRNIFESATDILDDVE